MNPQSISHLQRFLDSWIPFRLRNSDVTGVSVCIRAGDDDVYVGAHGLADLQSGETLTVDHTIEIASQTKMFTSLVALILHRKGRIELFDRLTDVLPELAGLHEYFATQPLTIHDLIAHRSGLPRDFHPEADADNAISAAVHTLQVDGPTHRPAYSNLGYGLLVEILERTQGQSFEELVRHQLLEPLKLSRTFLSRADVEGPVSMGHGLALDRRMPTTVDRLRNGRGSVGLWSTPSDLCTFARAHMHDDSFLDTGVKAMQHAIQWGPDASTGHVEFALGLESRRVSGRRFLGHSGGANGFVSATYFRPDDNIAISLALNCRDPRVLEELSVGLINAVYFFADAPVEPTSDRLTQFAGRFGGTVSVFEVLAVGETLAIVDPLHWNPFHRLQTMSAINQTRCIMDGTDFNFGNLPVDYTFDPKGRVSTLRLGDQLLKPI